ncbi:hypothetical protein [Methanosarcina sp. 1.H.T.1A.1]|nr:hypothetical protein [Methanosarcina sp. 1.H.T.1A.1]
MTSEAKVSGILRLAALKIKCRLPFQALSAFISELSVEETQSS